MNHYREKSIVIYCAPSSATCVIDLATPVGPVRSNYFPIFVFRVSDGIMYRNILVFRFEFSRLF